VGVTNRIISHTVVALPDPGFPPDNQRDADISHHTQNPLVWVNLMNRRNGISAGMKDTGTGCTISCSMGNPQVMRGSHPPGGFQWLA
jgi:hypothetical protein